MLLDCALFWLCLSAIRGDDDIIGGDGYVVNTTKNIWGA
jgi:hypothetical protein